MTDNTISDATTASYENPFEIIDSPWGHIERWRASTMACGSLGALAQVYEIVRNDAAEAARRVDEVEARKALVQHLCDQVAAMQERINALADALEARHKADAESDAQEAAFEEEPLSLPPGEEPATPDKAHTPGGELHDLPPKDDSELPKPPLGVDQAELPQPTPLEDPLDDPIDPHPKGSVYPQPISISLNEE